MTSVSVVPSALLRRVSKFAPAVATCGALLAVGVAVLGYTLLGFLFLSRYYAPASHHYVRPLNFDYTGYVAVAVAPLSPNLREQVQLDGSKTLAGAATALVPKSRFLPSGSQVAVHVCLVIPRDHTDLFQVTGELLTNTSHVSARSVRTYINTQQPYAYRFARQLLLLPLHIIGWGHGDWVTVDLPLFDAYEDREDAPVVAFRAQVASRNASQGSLPPPPVYRAEVHVRLRLGFLQTVLFWMRPGLAASIVLLLVGTALAVGGTSGTLMLVVLACLLRRWVRRSEEQAARMRKGALPIAPPPKAHKDKQPYGSLKDALAYSLAHAQYYRGGGNGHREATWVADQDEAVGNGGGGVPYVNMRPQQSDRMSRQGSATSQQRMYDSTEDAPSYDAAGAVHWGQGGSPGWSGSSEGRYPPTDPAVAAAGGRNPSRQGSGAAAVPSKVGDVRSGETVAARPGAGGDVEDEQTFDDGSDIRRGGRRGYDSVKQMSGSRPRGGEALAGDVGYEEAVAEEHGEQHRVEEEGEGDEWEATGADGRGPAFRNEEETWDYDKAGSDGGGEEAAKGGLEPERRSDLDPQADNEAAGGALRKRAAFTWKA